MKEIKICENHPEFEVPLIWTFAFNGAEYWCPYCGQNSGMLGAGEDIEETPELKERLKIYKKYSKKFLHANAILVCAETKYKGEWIKPKDLPRKEIDRLAKIREDWKYEVKL